MDQKLQFEEAEKNLRCAKEAVRAAPTSGLGHLETPSRNMPSDNDRRILSDYDSEPDAL